ncbi:MAG: serine protease [Planctomycetes bacterium]|nr:serine protease [Planctomycetota bacterium]
MIASFTYLLPGVRSRVPAAIFALVGTAVASAGGFDRAIGVATPRVVKLYGLGVGLQAGYGTGVLVSADGLVLTVSSLLIDAEDVRAVGADGTRYHAEVLYRDAARQLALLQLRPGDGAAPRAADADEVEGGGASGGRRGASRVGPLPYFDLGVGPDGRATAGVAGGCTAKLAPGDWVLAAGNPFKVADGPEPMSVAHGVFSTRTHLDARRRVKDFPYTGEVLVLDAITSNPGGEGSAVVNLEGEFVGMVGRVVISNRTHTHFNYAMPCDVLRDFLTEALRSSEGSRPPPTPTVASPASNLGIKMARTGYQKVLPFVERVRPGSPADRAGVRADDLVLSVNGRTVADLDAYDARLKALPPGRPVELVVRRGRSIVSVEVQPESP